MNADLNLKIELETESIFNELSRISSIINQVTEKNSDLTKVLVLGQAGSGKSSIISTLTNQEVKVKKKEKKFLKFLEGKNIFNEYRDNPDKYLITIDNNSKMIYFECPIETDENLKGKIIRSFFIDKIFQENPNLENKIKILLVASISDIQCCHGTNIYVLVDFICNLLNFNENLIKNVGFVITKCDRQDNKYLIVDELSYRKESLYKLMKNMSIDNFFSFPIPRKDQLNAPYHYEDHDSLMQFLAKDPLVNPKYKIEISDYRMTIVLDIILHKMSKLMKNIFDKIEIEYQECIKSEEKCHLKDLMFDVMKHEFKSVKDIETFFRENIQSVSEYEEYLNEMKSIEYLDSFMSKVFDSKWSLELNKMICSLSQETIDSLHLTDNS
ncbi:hypothetical protein M9Y10_011045 [Tritrichomonas musculus]|uniref:G domain-containing protein n=1 Tax=Tritrichomonas musculus TaxID=1915356 RepID=A0ABR2INK4_9EUKA